MPQKIFSDRDPRLTSAFWKEVTRLTGMMSGMTTAYHPQANGGAERSNQTMEQVLRAYVGEMGSDWDQHLSAVEYAMNNTVSRATKMKPFVMMRCICMFVCMFPRRKNANLISKPNQASGYSTEWYMF